MAAQRWVADADVSRALPGESRYRHGTARLTDRSPADRVGSS